MSNGFIALITDFGARDGFTGVMKGVMHSIAGQVTLVDVAHDIPPQNIRHASWVLEQAFPVFPLGTFFLCVVDPGVGSTAQHPLVLYSETLQKGVVCPDNGLATRILDSAQDWEAYWIENPTFHWKDAPPSQTFHGRDIYAPTAAHLLKAYTQNSLRSRLTTVGSNVSLSHIVRLPIRPPQQTPTGNLTGEVDLTDTYGNLITTIPSAWLPPSVTQCRVQFPDKTVLATQASCYATDHAGLLIVHGSHGKLELALTRDSAARQLGVSPGTLITLDISL